MNFPKINLHIHSRYSDGKNSIKQIVEKSLELGLEYIAITDHFSNSWKEKIISTLNSDDKIDEYLEEIAYFQNYLKENKEILILYKGIEIDLGSSERFIKKHVQADKFDLILFEYLETPNSFAFINNIIQYWKKSTLSSRDFPLLGLAHFDPSLFIQGDLDMLIQFLKKYNIYFEFNSRYPEFYSRQNELFFEKIKKYDVPVAMGSDSHDLIRLNDIEEPLEMIQYYELKSNLNLFLEMLKK